MWAHACIGHGNKLVSVCFWSKASLKTNYWRLSPGPNSVSRHMCTSGLRGQGQQHVNVWTPEGALTWHRARGCRLGEAVHVCVFVHVCACVGLCVCLAWPLLDPQFIWVKAQSGPCALCHGHMTAPCGAISMPTSASVRSAGCSLAHRRNGIHGSCLASLREAKHFHWTKRCRGQLG